MSKPKSDLAINTEGWKTINWRKAERYVFKLQKRIYTASRAGDVKRVRRLQKTLMRSWFNRVLSVRRVTQDNQGKKTAGVDGVKSLSPEARFELAKTLKATGKSKPTRRVWIPKPGSKEKRPLGIPVMYDRALQSVVKAALEPEWEAHFEPNSYGFRPGRSCQDAVAQIKYAIQHKAKFALDADIAKCFDRIDHLKLLQKLNQRGTTYRQIKAWLKSGVIDVGAFTATSEGTPQGGVISPLLANIALHGLEAQIKQEFPRLSPTSRETWYHKKGKEFTSPIVVRYADDFVVLHADKAVVQRCREIISEWLKDIGLELKPEKTRLTHTLNPELSDDGTAGFDFLGFHIQQYPAGKYRSSRNLHQKITGFITLITPTKKASQAHTEEIGRIIRQHHSSPQIALISALNPVIRGWANYYRFSDAKTTGEFSRQDHLLYLKLRSWAKRRCKGSLTQAYANYWHTVGDDNWVFSTREGSNSFRLMTHREVQCSSTSYVKVKGDKSLFDGDLVYWSIRMGTYPQMSAQRAKLLKRQRGKCAYCGHHFKDGDVLEIDHILPKALGGKDEYNNLQLLHRHCHDRKTRTDLKDIQDNRPIRLNYQEQLWRNEEWKWINDIPVSIR